ncbi:hypothetical protein [Deinococcus sp. UR1]|uniref:hypothetical protein n=1 Tax=Deinococcus sp. UR1 TaxID=1704277 RepID=UPI0011AF3266|nr:hypothetical protein [Deinococcus sp. UR1]
MPRPLHFLGSLVLTALAASAGATALSGEARNFVERLGRASGVPLSASLFAGTSASQRVASTFQNRGRCVTASTLAALQRQPVSPGVRAMLILELRCVQTVNGQALTPASALALANGMGLDVANINALLNDPLAVNRLLDAAQRPVTPITPTR